MIACAPFNGEKSCKSWVKKNSYNITVDQKSNNTLTNTVCEQFFGGGMCSDFTITELEVWSVIKTE